MLSYSLSKFWVSFCLASVEWYQDSAVFKLISLAHALLSLILISLEEHI